jgi:hypothetical protein
MNTNPSLPLFSSLNARLISSRSPSCLFLYSWIKMFKIYSHQGILLIYFHFIVIIKIYKSMNIWLKGQQLALMNITTLFQICVTIIFVGLKWRRTMEKSFVEFDFFCWLKMIKNCLAISYKHDFNGFLKM